MANSTQTVTFEQAGRRLSVETDLGQDAFVLTAFEGEERLSSLFHYRLELASARKSIAPEDVLGKNVTFHVAREAGTTRCFNGVIGKFAAGPMWDRDYRRYYAEVVPWLWFLTRTTDCRIFQEKSVPDIVTQIFGDLRFSDFDLAGVKTGAHQPREYCVQYRETDFDFISRLLEEEGIFYFFKHERGKHKLILADQRSAYVDCADKEVEFRSGSAIRGHLSAWRPSFSFRSGKWAQKDYEFTASGTDLTISVNSVLRTPTADRYEFYDYPGGYDAKQPGQRLTEIRMEEEEAAYAVSEGESDCSGFSPGMKFKIVKHECPDEEGKTYVITGVRHAAAGETHMAGGAGTPEYANSFTCIPETVAYRPPRVTPKPVVHGAQTAVVAGPDKDVQCDEYGRVKVVFHWDRERQSSCWIRVAQLWAGPKWGALFTPRPDMEVVVDFLEGDPDRPIIVGCVYNDLHMPPYTLPANKTQSGIKTRSTPNGAAANFNELRFEDKKGSEEIYFHAEKDFKRVVKNDDSLEVKHDQTITVTNNRTGTVEQGNDSTKVRAGKSTLEAMKSIELKVGQNSITIDQSGITLKGMMIKVEGQMVEAKGPMVTVSGTGMLTLKGGLTKIN